MGRLQEDTWSMWPMQSNSISNNINNSTTDTQVGLNNLAYCCLVVVVVVLVELAQLLLKYWEWRWSAAYPTLAFLSIRVKHNCLLSSLLFLFHNPPSFFLPSLERQFKQLVSSTCSSSSSSRFSFRCNLIYRRAASFLFPAAIAS